MADGPDRMVSERHDGLERTRWRLAAYGVGSGELRPCPADVRATARFDSGRVVGSGGCNRFGGSYRVAGDRLVVGQVVATLMACPGPAGEVEQRYLPALERVASFRVDGARLELADAAGHLVLTFVAVPDPGLTGRVWVATGVNNGAGGVSSLLPAPLVTAEFADGGTVSGSTGCNRFTGSYRGEAERLQVGPLATTRRACPPQVMAQERQFLAAVGRVTRCVIDDDRLDLTDDEDALQVSFRAQVTRPGTVT